MWLFRYYKLIVITFVLLFIGAGYFATQLKVAYNIENFFPQDDPHIEFYKKFRKEFGQEDKFLLIGIHREGGIFHKPLLEKADSLCRAMDTLPHAKNVLSITNYKDLLKTPFGFTRIPVLHVDQPDRYAEDSARIMQDDRLYGKLISRSGTSLNILLENDTALKQSEAEALNDQLFQLLEKFDLPEYHVAGRANIQTVFVRTQIEEMKFYTALAASVTLLVLFLLYRRFWPVFISFISVVGGMVLFIGLLGLFQVELTFMAILFPVLLIIVGMSDVVHISTKYLDQLRGGKSEWEATSIALREIGWATFLTSLTTAIGFASLYTSHIEPVQEFGLMAAAGVFVAYFTVILFTSSLQLWLGHEKVSGSETTNTLLDRLLEYLYDLTLRRKRAILVTFGLLIIITVYGISLINTNVKLKVDLPKDKRIYQDYKFFEREFGGFRLLEIGVIAKGDHKIDDYKMLQQIDSLVQYFQQSKYYEGITSPATLYKSLNMAFNANKLSAYEMPDDTAQYKNYSEYLEKAPGRMLNTIISKDKKLGRISGRMSDVGTDNADSLRNAMHEWANSHLDTSMIALKPTGKAVMFDQNNDYFVSSLTKGLGLAFFVVSLVMAFLFRNLRMVVIALVPNVFPLMLTGAIMGFMGMSLNAATSIIYTIAFGIAVDDSIHFLSKYKIERQRGQPIEQAIHSTMNVTGKALVITTIILFAGFFMLATSSYMATFRVGSLISLTLVIALITDLLLLPIFIRSLIRSEEDIAKKK